MSEGAKTQPRAAGCTCQSPCFVAAGSRRDAAPREKRALRPHWGRPLPPGPAWGAAGGCALSPAELSLSSAAAGPGSLPGAAGPSPQAGSGGGPAAAPRLGAAAAPRTAPPGPPLPARAREPPLPCPAGGEPPTGANPHQQPPTGTSPQQQPPSALPPPRLRVQAGQGLGPGQAAPPRSAPPLLRAPLPGIGAAWCEAGLGSCAYLFICFPPLFVIFRDTSRLKSQSLCKQQPRHA